MSGLCSLIGDGADDEPGLAPLGTIDILAAVYAGVGILMALLRRGRTGEGTHLDVSMYDVGAAFLERPLTLYEFTGEVQTRGVDRFAPVGLFRCGDGGWVSVVIPTDEMWRRCCIALGRPDVEADPRLDSMLKRSAAMQEVIVPVFEEWAAPLSRHEAVARLQAAGQPAGLVQTIDDVRHCPHLAGRGLFTAVPDPVTDRDGEPLRLPRLPLSFDGYTVPGRRSPRLGEHNAEILGALP
jgi:crotonobetainyl-CoA:carnitine CoA-transferase CaiB-like acyl-CoA transferase